VGGLKAAPTNATYTGRLKARPYECDLGRLKARPYECEEYMNKLSVVIITKNEEHNMRRCLESVKWADEVVIYDSGSVDRTLDICKEYGCAVYNHPVWEGFGRAKHEAVCLAKNDWVFVIDADEVCSEALQNKILSVLSKREGAFAPTPPCPINGVPTNTDTINGVPTNTDTINGVPTNADTINGVPTNTDTINGVPTNTDTINGVPTSYTIKRNSFYLGKEIKHSGWQRDYTLRLFNRQYGNFNDKIVHEYVETSTPIGRISEVLFHYTYPNISTHLDKMLHYSRLNSEQLLSKRKKGSICSAFFHALGKFFKMYVVNGGFLDGKVGFILAVNSSFGVWIKYVYHWELTRDDGNHALSVGDDGNRPAS